jgi:hypothetical protein
MRLDRHVSHLGLSLAAYFATLVLFWSHMLGVATLPLAAVLTLVVAAAANYLFLVWTAYKIQRMLHEAGLQKHGAWQVWVGALFLHPAMFGWYIPVSVLFSARRIRRQLRECNGGSGNRERRG